MYLWSMKQATTILGELTQRRISITEIKAGWAIEDGEGWAEVHPTAADALKVIKERDACLADCGVSTMTIITWIPASRVGQMVARVIGG